MKKNKGFTLVEVIVILVILAILAAILIPSLTTYIDKAKEKQITSNARAAYVATQALASEAYGLNTAEDFKYEATNDNKLAVLKLAQLDKDGAAPTTVTFTFTVGEDGNVTAFEYKDTAISPKNAIWNSTTGAWKVS